MMRKTMLFFIIAVLVMPIFSADNSALTYFFDNKPYHVKELSLSNSTGQRLKLAFTLVEGSDSIISKGVIYISQIVSIEAYVLILGPHIVAPNWASIIDVSKAPGAFWGWEVVELTDAKTGIVSGISLTYFADKGKRVADAIDMNWYAKSNKFGVISADRSQW